MMRNISLVIVVLVLVGAMVALGKETTMEAIRLEKLNLWSRAHKKSQVTLKDWDYSEEMRGHLKASEPVEGPKERGIFATGDIAEGAEIIGIPWMSVLSLDLIAVELNEFYDVAKKYNLTEEDFLVIGLLIYKSCMEQESFGLKYWVRTLPMSYSNALYFTSKELELLKGSPAFVLAMVELSYLDELYDRMAATLFKTRYMVEKCTKDKFSENAEPVFTKEQLRWAMATINSRKVYSMNPDDDRLTVIVPPLVDFANYNAEPSGSIEMKNYGGKLVLVANRDIATGEQVTLEYSSQDCNSDLLVDYGFFDFNANALPCVNVLYEELLETIAEDDPIRMEKIHTLNTFMFPQQTEDNVVAQPPRLKLFKSSLTEELLKISQYLSYKTSSLIPYIRSLIELKQSHYPTSVAQDEKFLASPEYQALTYGEKLAFHVAYSEKTILYETDKHLEAQEEELKQQLREQRRLEKEAIEAAAQAAKQQQQKKQEKDEL